jgi:TP901 family phage tail tape measure protein
MANNLKISLIATLDKQLSKDEINKKIKEIEGQFGKINLQIKIDDTVMKKLTELTSQLKKFGSVSTESSKLIEENNKKQAKSVDELTQKYSKLINQVNKYNKDGSLKSTTSTYQDDKGNGRIINTNATGSVTSYKDVENLKKFENETKNLQKTLQDLARTGKYSTDELRKIGQGINVASTIKELDNLKNRMAGMKLDNSFGTQIEKVQRSLKNMYDSGLTNEKFFKNFNKVINSAKNVAELDKIKAALERVSDTGKNKNLQQSLLTQANSVLSSGSKKLDTAGLTNLITSLKNIKPNASSASNELNKLKNQLKEYSSQVGNAHNITKSFGQSLKDAFKSFSVFSLATTAFYAPIKALEDMASRLIEIDTLMTEIRRVMDMPDFKFTQLLQEAVDTSDELSTKLKDTLSIMGDFGRMGFDSNQLVDITKTAQVLQNISDLDATSSVDTLTSAMLNFNIAADQSITIADKLNEVDNNFAISTKDLSDGIRKAAASAKTFGVDINQLTGYIAAVGSTTRESGSIIGNGLKTIFSRMTTMDEAVGALESVGVSVKDLAGNVRPVSDIMSNLASKWTNLSDEQRQNTAVSVAGRYQLTRFLALMNNFSIAQSATATAVNSSGSAMKEQAKYADSLEARINRLDTAWNKFTIAMGNAFLTDSLVSGIETLNSLATTVAGFVNKFGALGSIFGIIGIAVVGLNTKLKTFATSLVFGTTGMTRMQIASAGLSAGMTRLEIATVGAKTALKGLAASTVVGLAFVAVGYAIEKLIGSYSDAKQAQEDFEASQQKGMDSLKNNREEIDKLLAQYEQMSRAKKILGDTWSSDQETKYLQIQQKLADLYPQLISNIDGAGNAHLKTKKQIEKEIDATEKLINAKKKLTKETALSDFDKQLSKMNDLQKQKANKSDPLYQESYDKFGLIHKLKNPFDLLDKEKIAKNKYEIEALQNQWSSAAQKINSKVLEIASAYSKLKIDSNIQKNVDDFVSSLDLSKIKSPEKLEAYSKKIGYLTDKMQKAYQSGDAKAYEKAQDQLVSYSQKIVGAKQHVYDMSLSFTDLKKAVEMGANAIFAGKDGMDGLDESATETTQSIEALTKASMENASVTERMVGSTQEMIDQTKDQITAYQLLSNVEKRSAEQKKALSDATAYLNKLYPEFIDKGKLNVEQMRKQVEAEEILLKAVTDVTNGHADAEEIMTTNAALQSKARLKIISDQIDAYSKLVEAAYAAAEADGGEMTGARANIISTIPDKIAGLKSQVDALSNSYSAQVQKLADTTGYQGQYYNAVDKSNDKSKDAVYVTDKYKQALEAVNAQISQLENSQKKYATDSAQYRSALQKEIDLQTQKLKLMQDQEKSLASQIKSGKIVQTGMVSDSSSTTSAPPSSGSYNWNNLGGKLAGSGSLMEKYGNMYGISPALLAAIAMHETGNGTSSAVRNKNNAFGIMGSNGLKSFTSLEESIKYAASLLKKNYIDKGLTTVEAIQKKYAPVGVANDPTGLNKNWVNGVNKFISLVSGATKSVTSNNSGSGGISALIAEARRQSNLGTFTYQQIGGDFKGTYQQFLNRALSDCSQFVQEYFQNFLNTNVPRTAAEQWKAGQSVAKGQQQIGDLVFWNTTGKAHSHVGIYTGNGKVMQMGTKGLKEIDVSDIKGFEGYKRIAGASSASSSSAPSAADAAQAVDQAKSDLLGLQTDIQSTSDLIKQLQEEIVQSKIDQVVNSNENLLNYVDGVIQKSQLLQQQFKEGSTQWTKAMSDQIIYQKKKIQITNDEIAGLQNLLKTEKLSAAQKAEVNQKIQELTLSQLDYLNTIDQIYDKERDVQTQAKVDAVQKLYDGEIKKLQDKLDKLDEVEKAEERITQQKELQDQIDKAKSDKSHQYIDSNGNVQLTYDKGAVADLEKQMSDLKDGWAKEDAKQSLQDQIAALETKRDDSIAKLQKLNEDYQTKMFKNTTDLTNTMNQFVKDLGFIFGNAVKLPKHHTGGTVGSQSSSLGNLFNKLFNVGNNEQVIKALKGEVVINPNLPKVQNNFKNLIDIMSSGRQTGTVDQSKNITIQKIEIKANNPMEFFQGLDNALRSI